MTRKSSIPPADELPHIDELPDYNATADWAVDNDGTRYKVSINSFNAQTTLTPEERVLTDEKRAQRDGVGEPCHGCGNEIPFYAIIIRDTRGDSIDYYHCGCYDDA